MELLRWLDWRMTAGEMGWFVSQGKEGCKNA